MEDPLANPSSEEGLLVASTSSSPSAVGASLKTEEEEKHASSSLAAEPNSSSSSSSSSSEHQQPSINTRIVLWGAVANLCSATLGAGILSLPYAFAQAGLLAGFILLLLSALATALSIRILVQACDYYQVYSYEALVERLNWRWARPCVEACTLLFCGGVMVAYCIAVGDILELSGLLIQNSRQWSMLVVWTVIMLPLSLLRTMRSLQFASSVGIASIATLVFASLVHLIDDQVASASNHTHDNNNTTTTNTTDFEMITLMASNNSTDPPNNPTLNDWTACLWPANGVTSILTACPIILFAFSCQVNVCAIYYELPVVTVEYTKLHLMQRVAWTAVTVCATLYATLSVAVLSDFGATAVMPNVLLNYFPPTGILQVATASMAVAVVLAFPLNIFPARVTLMGMVHNNNNTRQQQQQGNNTSSSSSVALSVEDPESPSHQVGSTDGRNSTSTTTTALEPLSVDPSTPLLARRRRQNAAQQQQSAAAANNSNHHHTLSDADSDFDWTLHVALTVALAGSALGLALVVPNISVVFGLLGGTTASLLGFVVPGALGLRLCRETSAQQVQQQRTLQAKSWILLAGGILVGVVTTGATLYTTWS